MKESKELLKQAKESHEQFMRNPKVYLVYENLGDGKSELVYIHKTQKSAKEHAKALEKVKPNYGFFIQTWALSDRAFAPSTLARMPGRKSI